MKAPTLPLKGARKKADPKPRSEGLTKRSNGVYYLRVYLPGSKRATYLSTRQCELRAADAVVTHLRARVFKTQPIQRTKHQTQGNLL